MLKRTIITVIAMSMLLLSFGLVSATNQDEKMSGTETRYQYIERISVGLSITNGTAKVTTEVKDIDGDTTSLSCTATLQRKMGDSWKKVRSWSKSTQSNTLYLSKSKNVSKGKYRVKSVVKAYRRNDHETVTKYSGTVTY